MTNSKGKTAHAKGQSGDIITRYPHHVGPVIGMALLSATLMQGVATAGAPNTQPQRASSSLIENDFLPPPDAAAPWLNEVRAQRKAWEAQRAAARETYEQRRRLNNPRSAAHQEAWEEDLRRRRAERQARIDRDREMFRNLGPRIPLPDAPFNGGDSADDTDLTSPQAPLFPPPGWNNLWYFRGF